MQGAPEVRYVKTPTGAHIAYQVLGEGPPDVALMLLWSTHVDLAWEVPEFARLFRKIASFSRLIRFDPLGSGLSDPLGLNEQPTVEERAQDLLAVLDAIGVAQISLVANNISGLLAMFFAATYPERTAALVLDGCYARFARAHDYPFGVPLDQLDRQVARAEGGTEGTPGREFLRFVAPSALTDAAFVAHWNRMNRALSSPARAPLNAQMAVYSDVRSLLATIQAPTLVLYREDDQFAGRPHAEYLAKNIAGARLVALPGADNLMIIGNVDAVVGEIQEFLTGARSSATADRVLATVLFTDIVGSTDRAAEVGDRRWRELLESHDEAVRRQLDRFRGHEVNTVGDGFLATFDGPGRAIECACAIRDVVQALGLEVRVGLHTGEVEVRGTDLAGLAVHIGARVVGLAEPGEVLVTSTVKDLVAGSGITFADRGSHELKGVPGPWHLFAVAG